MRLSRSCSPRPPEVSRRQALVLGGIAVLLACAGCSLRPESTPTERTPVVALYRNEIEASNAGARRDFGTVPIKLISRRASFQVRQVLPREGYAVAEIETDDGSVGWAVVRNGQLE